MKISKRLFMYVCLCRGVTDNQIKAAVYDGASSVQDLRRCLGVASQCGKCGITAKEILNETRSNSSAQFGGGVSYYAAM
jgi:bacterioferritin-associated ferredoxin